MLRGTLAALLLPAGLRIASAGTHPFSHWQDQLVTENDRYKILEEEMQDVIRELLIFGLHVHVGIPDRERRIEVMNEARYFLPHLLAISTSSPFWLTRATGLKSYRQIIWQRFPRTGIPPDFSSYDEFENYVELLVKTKSIDDGRKIWWDLRPHSLLPDDRVPRVRRRDPGGGDPVHRGAHPGDLREASGAARSQHRLPPLRAAAHPGEQVARRARGHEREPHRLRQATEVPMRDLAVELLEFVDDVVDTLGSRREVTYLEKIAREGTSADRQLATYAATGHLHSVVDQVAAETITGVPVLNL